MKVVILCGGQGTRFREETELKPKPMVEIGDKPIVWHIMKTYAHYGFNEFILCLGYKGEVIKEYFKDYQGDWDITLADTGLNAMTGARVKRVEKYIDTDDFFLTYGDGVTNLNITEVMDFHKRHKRIGTVTGVCPQSQYGELKIDGDEVVSFEEKPEQKKATISGGYFIFNRKIFNYIDDDEGCVLERKPLQRLAVDGQLKVYQHHGFWQCMDTYRDYKFLQKLWIEDQAEWKVWNE